MRAWFMLGAMTLGLLGWWGGQGRSGRVVNGGGGGGTVSAMDDPNPAPTPR